jgi:serine/threonine protein kinase
MSHFPARNGPQGNSMRTAPPEDYSSDDARILDGSSPSKDRISSVICDVIRRRGRGELVSSEEVISAHPELMPCLRDELNKIDLIHRSVLVAQVPSNRDIQSDSNSTGLEKLRAEDLKSVNESDHPENLRIQGYCIEREISSGGQATVFRAIQERTGRVVAVKVMHGGKYAGSRGRQRFDRESKILVRLNHPNLVSILDRGRTEDGSFFLVMDFIEGHDLDSFVKELGNDVPSIVRTFIKIALAVEEAHRHGIVHRDLKPMNILVDTRGEPHILDFGMARLLQEYGEVGDPGYGSTLTRTGQVLGSPPWSSPEQVSASPDAIDAPSDVYAIGIMLFTALAGEFPYPVYGKPGAIINHILTSPPASVTWLAQRKGTTVSPFLDEIVRRALRKSPTKRYRSAGQMAHDLEQCLTGKSKSLRRSIRGLSRAITFFATMAIFSLIPFDGSRPVVAKQFFVNEDGIRFVKIPAGSIALGQRPDTPSEIDWTSRPYFRADRSFYLSSTVITQQQYLRIIGRNPSDPGQIQLNAPVQCITWDEATEFCEKLSKREGHKYRLPTPMEWKYAFYSGESGNLTEGSLDDQAWFVANSGQRLQSVGGKVPNLWGLYDMLGNVRQWCSDATGEPLNSKAPLAVMKASHFAEGAGYISSAPDCLSPSKLETSYMADVAMPTIGFRIACDNWKN